ncbi:TonB-dependent receptor [Novosphingobium sediminicola]|uniref:Catecholate siderophore receptor n=1 Tax=Novosphingobium sediminicola TaxID=563162 RepID=A0A7W6G4L8_9SPHN|nr:TonB-dependent siderophore receptor [Novosphingobium sediminicola]MBB3953799.1 catecholate siderophore receptor [Novosphingobium sediminicola]
MALPLPSNSRAASAALLPALACALLPRIAHADTEASPAIIVHGQMAENRISLEKIETSQIDTPQSLTVLNQDEWQARGVNNLADALRMVPGISLGAGETSWQGNNASLRGFTTRDDMFLDGMRDFAYYYRDPFNSQSIEVLKGPAGILFGRGSTGGVIHQVSKAPESAASTAVSLAAGTDDTRRATLDANQPLGDHGALRVNAMGHTSHVAGRDEALNRRWGIAPTLALGMGTDTRLTLSYLHQEEHNRPDYGIPWFNGAPAPVARSNYYGFSDDYLNTTVNIVTLKLEHDVSNHLSLRNRTRYSSADRSFRTSEAAVPTGIAATTPLEAITVTRNEFSGQSSDLFLQNQTDITANFKTGAWDHTLVGGIELGQEVPRPTYIFHTGVIATNLANPLPQAFAETSSYVRLHAHARAATLGLYALDTIRIGEGWIAIAGLRWDRYKAHYQSTGYSATGAQSSSTDQSPVNRKLSLRGALVYKPAANGSLYLSYADSFNPSAEGITSMISSGRSVAQANLDLRPETGRVIEAGVKWSLLSNRLMASAAVFDTIKSNVRVPDPANSAFNLNGGRQRSRGMELEISGNITARWSLRAGYAYLDTATLWSANPDASGSPRIGAPLPLAPRHSGSLQSDYAFTPRLSAGLGLLFQSSRLGQNTNASYLVAPGYATLEARARYEVAPGFDVQINVSNLTNALYYDQLHPFHVIPGAARSALITLGWKG